MSITIRFFEKFFLDRRGATAIEYALIASLVALVIVASVGSTGEQVESIYTSIANSF
ncbi:MAG: Flp family type IVb pilin [Hyphomicrobiales bacterium]